MCSLILKVSEIKKAFQLRVRPESSVLAGRLMYLDRHVPMLEGVRVKAQAMHVRVRDEVPRS